MPASEEPGSTSGQGTAPLRTFAEKLDFLFETVRKPDGGTYNTREMAARIHERSGISITHTTLASLRKGARTNPTLDTIRGIASGFGVRPSFFVEDNEEIVNEIRDNVLRFEQYKSAQRDGLTLQFRQLGLVLEEETDPDMRNHLANTLDGILRIHQQSKRLTAGREPQSRPDDPTPEQA